MKQPEENYEKNIIIPVTKETWKALKTISFNKEVSMCSIARAALLKEINKLEKAIDTK